MIKTCPNCGGLFATENMEMFGGTPCLCGYAQTFSLATASQQAQINQLKTELTAAIKERDEATDMLSFWKAECEQPNETPEIDAWCELAVSADISAVLDLAKIYERKYHTAIKERDEARKAAEHYAIEAGTYASQSDRHLADINTLQTTLREVVEASAKYKNHSICGIENLEPKLE